MFKIFLYAFHLLTALLLSPKEALVIYFGFKMFYHVYSAARVQGGNQ